MMRQFTAGDGRGNVGLPVQFTSTAKPGRPSETHHGVVSKFNGNRRRPRYTVSAEGSAGWNIPEQMLSPSTTFSEEQQGALLAKGDIDEQERDANKGKRDSRKIDAMRGLFDLLTVRQAVEVYTSDAFGGGTWRKTEIVELMPDAGKVKVVNPTALLQMTAERHGATGMGSRRKPGTITVWADRIR